MSNHTDSSREIVIDTETSSYFLGKCTIRSRLAYISYLIMQFLKSKADQWHAWKANLEKNPKYKKPNDQQHKNLLGTYLCWSNRKQSSFSSGFCRIGALTASLPDRTLQLSKFKSTHSLSLCCCAAIKLASHQLNACPPLHQVQTCSHLHPYQWKRVPIPWSFHPFWTPLSKPWEKSPSDEKTPFLLGRRLKKLFFA